MNTPLPISVDEIIHAFEQPCCVDTPCPCNAPLRDAHAEAAARIVSIERGMSLLQALLPLREDEGARWQAESEAR